MNLEEIKERESGAAPGPWVIVEPFKNEVYIEGGNKRSVAYIIHDDDERHTQKADADFIAHAREDIPVLISEIKRLRLSFAYQCSIGNLSVAQVATALNISQDEVRELIRRIPSPVLQRKEW